MSLSKVPTGEMLYKGALFGAGVLGVFLWRKDVLPMYMGIIFTGTASLGLCTVIWDILKEKGKKRSNVDFRPIEAFYEEIACQYDKELSQQDSQRGGLEVERHTVRETDELGPMAYFRSGMKLSEVYKRRREASDRGNFLKTCADSFKSKEVSTIETKVHKSSAVAPLKLPLSKVEDKPPINSISVKKKQDISRLGKIKLSPLDATPEKSCCKGQISQNIPGQEMWPMKSELVTLYPGKKISSFNWRNVRKLLEAHKDKKVA